MEHQLDDQHQHRDELLAGRDLQPGRVPRAAASTSSPSWRATARETAQVNYGARGWVAHHNADLWRQTAPVGNWRQGDPIWANWPMGGAWLCQHLWEH